MTKKTLNTVNFTLILATCLLFGFATVANHVGGFAVLIDNLSAYNIGSIIGGGFGLLLGAIILAIVFNFILNIIRRLMGKEKKLYSYFQIWAFVLIIAVLKLAPLI